MTTTLLAVTGLSPAIITETLWALATEEPRVMPSRVVFLTTVTGAAALEEQLFTPRPDWGGCTVWQELRHCLGAKENELIAEEPKVISLTDGTSGRALPLDDLRTPRENAAAAEAIFREVWNVVRDKEQCLIASIAGGRKTMGALLHAAVSLIGRETDRLTHVLVDSPYDSLPGFFFPTQPDQPLLDRAGRAYAPSAARPTLTDVPFVPLRNRFRDLDDLPQSFHGLREEVSRSLRNDAERPIPLLIDYCKATLTVDGIRHKLRPRALAVLHFVLKCQEKKQALPDFQVAADGFNAWITKHPETGMKDPLTREDLSRELNFLREKLRGNTWKPAKGALHQAPFQLEIVP